jgi:hypothetical protein
MGNFCLVFRWLIYDSTNYFSRLLHKFLSLFFFGVFRRLPSPHQHQRAIIFRRENFFSSFPPVRRRVFPPRPKRNLLPSDTKSILLSPCQTYTRGYRRSRPKPIRDFSLLITRLKSSTITTALSLFCCSQHNIHTPLRSTM